MYLTDAEIKALLPDIGFNASDDAIAFAPDIQVQPCSVDLRLDSVYWLPHPRKRMSLARTHLLELSPRRYWRQLKLKPGEVLRLRPGDFLLCRTCESFAIPEMCAGRLEGRSSFGRMGLVVHCTAGFINPGWRGRMPLALVNLGRHVLEVAAGTPICQLMFIRLGSRPTKSYGDLGLASKYMDDDGGPSYWWRDPRIEALKTAFLKANVTASMQNDILGLVGGEDIDLIERLEDFVGGLRTSSVTNANDLLTAFGKSERWRSIRHRGLRALGRLGIITSLFSLDLFFVKMVIDAKAWAWNWVVGVTIALLIALVWGLYTFFNPKDKMYFLVPTEVSKLLASAKPKTP